MRIPSSSTYDLPEEPAKTASRRRLILQPLVENSMIHGDAAPTAPAPAIIAIAASGGGGRTSCWTVRDDGEKRHAGDHRGEMNRFLHHRRRGDQLPSDYGIGISNVHDRVQMCFGEGYGLTFERVGQRNGGHRAYQER